MTRKETAEVLTKSLLAFWTVSTVSALLFFALSGRWEWIYLIYATLGFPAIVIFGYVASFAIKHMSWVETKQTRLLLIIFPGLRVLTREYQQEQRRLAESEER